MKKYYLTDGPRYFKVTEKELQAFIDGANACGRRKGEDYDYLEIEIVKKEKENETHLRTL